MNRVENPVLFITFARPEYARQTFNAIAIKIILLHAREYPSGSTPSKSKLNTDPSAAIMNVIIDKVMRVFTK